MARDTRRPINRAKSGIFRTKPLIHPCTPLHGPVALVSLPTITLNIVSFLFEFQVREKLTSDLMALLIDQVNHISLRR